MSENLANPSVQPLEVFKRMPVGKVVLIAFAVVAMIAVAVTVVNISSNPTKQILFANLDPSEVSSILQILEKNSIEYTVQGNDTVLIPSKFIGAMKMELASAGYPRGKRTGYDAFDKDSGMYGRSETEKRVLYKRAIETEIETSIRTLDAVKTAKVLLAIPNSTRLLREKGKVKASVTVVTWDGASLDKRQVKGIVKILVDSVPDLHQDNVTVVDQTGALLSSPDENSAVSSSQVEYVQNLEKSKQDKVISMVESFVGKGNVRVAVTANVDFTHREVRRDDFDSSDPAIRSQQVSTNNNGSSVGGIAGAFSNQPPAAGLTPEGDVGRIADGGSQSASSDSVTNFEVDKSSFYEVLGKGALNKMTVSVVVNHKVIDDGMGGEVLQERTDQEMMRINNLVKAAVGFDDQRGDILFVSAEQFKDESIDVLVSDVAPPFWESVWVGDAINQLIGIVFLVVVYLVVFKPIMRSTSRSIELQRANDISLAQEREKATVLARIRQNEAKNAETPEEKFRQSKAQVDNVVNEDPKLTNQILRHWMSSENNK